MKLVKKYKMLGSSQDPDSISLTIKGLGLALVPVIIMVARMFDVELVEATLIQLVNAIVTIASMGMVIYGIFRKVK